MSAWDDIAKGLHIGLSLCFHVVLFVLFLLFICFCFPGLFD